MACRGGTASRVFPASIMGAMEISLNINGHDRRLDLAPGITLLEALRDYVGLTGTKYGCGEGQCGACTVLIDGRAAKSCIVSAASATGKKIVTIEGLSSGQGLHPVQQAFLDHAAFQCGAYSRIVNAVRAAASKRKESGRG